MQRAEEVCAKTVLCGETKGKHCFYVKHVNEVQIDPKWRSDVLLWSCNRKSRVYMYLISPASDAATKETDLNKISFSHLPSLLCKLRRHAGTAAIKQRMTMVMFLMACCTRLLLQPDISHSLVGQRRHGGKERKGNLLSSPLYLWLNILYAQLS